MDGQAIVDRAEARFGDSANTVYTAAEWLSYVNEAYREIMQADAYWPWLESRDTTVTVTSSGEATLPADVWKVTAVYDATNEMPLAPIPGRADFRHYFPDPDANLGLPLYYRLRGNTIELYPRPSSTVTLHLDVLAPPADIATNTEPVFPEQYHILLVYGALAHAHLDDENIQMSERYDGRFERGIERMKNDLLASRTESFPEIVDLGV